MWDENRLYIFGLPLKFNAYSVEQKCQICDQCLVKLLGINLLERVCEQMKALAEILWFDKLTKVNLAGLMQELGEVSD